MIVKTTTSKIHDARCNTVITKHKHSSFNFDRFFFNKSIEQKANENYLNETETHGREGIYEGFNVRASIFLSQIIKPNMALGNKLTPD